MKLLTKTWNGLFLLERSPLNEHVFTILLTTYSTVLTLVVGYMGRAVSKHISGVSNSRKADMLTLRLILIDMHDKYIGQQYIPRSAFATFEEIWELYHDGYNGNTLTDIFHEEVKNLEIREG